MESPVATPLPLSAPPHLRCRVCTWHRELSSDKSIDGRESVPHEDEEGNAFVIRSRIPLVGTPSSRFLRLDNDRAILSLLRACPVLMRTCGRHRREEERGDEQDDGPLHECHDGGLDCLIVLSAGVVRRVRESRRDGYLWAQGLSLASGLTARSFCSTPAFPQPRGPELILWATRMFATWTCPQFGLVRDLIKQSRSASPKKRSVFGRPCPLVLLAPCLYVLCLLFVGTLTQQFCRT